MGLLYTAPCGTLTRGLRAADEIRVAGIGKAFCFARARLPCFQVCHSHHPLDAAS